MKNILLIPILIFGNLGLKAQNDTLLINQTINQLFEGMKTGDSNLVRDAFHTDGKNANHFYHQNW